MIWIIYTSKPNPCLGVFGFWYGTMYESLFPAIFVKIFIKKILYRYSQNATSHMTPAAKE